MAQIVNDTAPQAAWLIRRRNRSAPAWVLWCGLPCALACNAILGIEEARLVCANAECGAEPVGTTAQGGDLDDAYPEPVSGDDGTSSEQPLIGARGDVADVATDAGAPELGDASLQPASPTSAPMSPAPNAPAPPSNGDDDDSDDDSDDDDEVSSGSCQGPSRRDSSGPGCGAPACAANETRCQGARLMRCNADRTALEPAGECASPEHCNEPAGRCNACVPNQARCADPSTVAVCDVTGQTETRLACAGLETCDDGRCAVLGLPPLL